MTLTQILSTASQTLLRKPPVIVAIRSTSMMGHSFIGKDDLLGLAISFMRGRSENKRCYQQKKQGCAEESNPEVDIVHF
ncbi:MAG: hypothetical protein WBM71_19815 [Sedimenticolaceae bacterium]